MTHTVESLMALAHSYATHFMTFTEHKHRSALRAALVAVQAVPAVTDEMVSRFLRWKLPRGFYPDGGITFSMKGRYEGFPLPDCWPIGKNLLTADQAREMLEHVLAAAPKGEV